MQICDPGQNDILNTGNGDDRLLNKKSGERTETSILGFPLHLTL